MKNFNVGDSVWVSSFETREVKTPCPVCFKKREVTVILGNGEEVVTECGYCGHGWGGPRGYVIEYERIPRAEYVTIMQKNMTETLGGLKVEYRLSSGRLSTDLFETEEEAIEDARNKAAKFETEQMANPKAKNAKSYTWNAGYHMREAKSKQRDVEYHQKKAQICKEKSRTK